MRLRAVAERVEAARDSVADEATATKWVAALSTGALFAIAQYLRKPNSSELFSLRETIGLTIGAIGFLVSIAAAGAFLFLVDLRFSNLLYRVRSRAIGREQRIRGINAALQHLHDADAGSPKEARASAELHDALQGDGDDGQGELLAAAEALQRRARRAETVTVRTNVAGFGIGLIFVILDFVAKMGQ